MDNIETIKLGDDTLYLKKSKIFGWGLVNPFRTNGKLNWKNILIGGSWFNLLKLAIILFLLVGCILEYSNAVTLANECLSKSIEVIF